MMTAFVKLKLLLLLMLPPLAMYIVFLLTKKWIDPRRSFLYLLLFFAVNILAVFLVVFFCIKLFLMAGSV